MRKAHDREEIEVNAGAEVADDAADTRQSLAHALLTAWALGDCQTEVVARLDWPCTETEELLAGGRADGARATSREARRAARSSKRHGNPCCETRKLGRRVPH